MSIAASAPPRRGSKRTIWLIVAAGLLLLLGANAHLVYVAVMSQPGCVAHAKLGQTTAASGTFSAAKSACWGGTP
jgi:hypothetical protein